MLSLNKDRLSWSNWSNAYTCHPQKTLSPNSEAEIISMIKTHKGSGFRIVGSGHSFSPLVPTDNTLISLDNLTGLIKLDLNTETVEVWAGTKLHELSELLHKNGLGLINMGDIDRQSIAGALCSGTHGTGHALGILSSAIEGLTLITPQGEVLNCSRKENFEVFNLARVNLGLLGVVTRLKIKVKKSYKLHFHTKKNSLHNCLAELEQKYTENRHFEFFWFPHTNTVQERYSNITNNYVMEKSKFRKKMDHFLENDVFFILSIIVRKIPALSISISKLCAFFMGNENRINYSHKIFANDRDVKFQEMELAVDIKDAKAALEKVDKVIRQNKIKVHFPIEVRFTSTDDIALSPCFERNSCFMAFHMFEGMEYKYYFKIIQDTLKEFQARPHWGKMSFLEKKDYSNLYPKLESFIELRRKLDPENKMLNPWLEKYFS
jgi:FAD-linked oxidoreductase